MNPVCRCKARDLSLEFPREQKSVDSTWCLYGIFQTKKLLNHVSMGLKSTKNKQNMLSMGLKYVRKTNKTWLLLQRNLVNPHLFSAIYRGHITPLITNKSTHAGDRCGPWFGAWCVHGGQVTQWMREIPDSPRTAHEMVKLMLLGQVEMLDPWEG